MVNWLRSFRVATLREWLFRFLVDEPAVVRTERLQAFRKSNPIPEWRVCKGTRTLAELAQRADQLVEAERVKEEKRKALLVL